MTSGRTQTSSPPLDPLLVALGFTAEELDARAARLRGVPDTRPEAELLRRDAWTRGDEELGWAAFCFVAFRIANTLPALEALLCGRAVPSRLLDGETLRRLGLDGAAGVQFTAEGIHGIDAEELAA